MQQKRKFEEEHKEFLQNKKLKIEDLQAIFDKISQDASYIKFILEEYGYNQNVLSTALKLNWECIKYIDEKDKNQNLFIENIKFYPNIFEYASEELKFNYNFILQCLELNPYTYTYLDESFKKQEVILNTVIRTSNGEILEYLSNELKDDRKIVWNCCFPNRGIFNTKLLQFASDRIKSNRELMLHFVLTSPKSLEFVSDDLKKDEEILKKCFLNMQQNDYKEILSYIPTDILYDKYYIFKLIELDYRIFLYLDLKFQQDKEIVLKALSCNPFLINEILTKFYSDRDVMELVSGKYGELLMYASKKLLQDKKLILLALENQAKDQIMKNINYRDVDIKNYVPLNLKNDKEISMKLDFKNFYISKQRIKGLIQKYYSNNDKSIFRELERDVDIFEYIPDIEKQNPKFLKECFETNINVFHFFSENMKNHNDIIQYIINLKRFNLLPDTYKDDEKIVFQTFNNNFQYSEISKRLLDTKSFVLKLIDEYHGYGIYPFLSDRLKHDYTVITYVIKTIPNEIPKDIMNDRQFILHLVQLNPEYIYHLSLELQNDREIIFKIIQNDFYYFFKFHSIIKDDMEILEYLVSKHGELLDYVTKDMFKDRRIILLALDNQGKILNVPKENWKQSIYTTLSNINVINILPSNLVENDREFLFKSLRKGLTTLSLKYIVKNHDIEMIIESIADHPDHIIPDLKERFLLLPKKSMNDKEILLKMVQKEPKVLKFISSKIKSSVPFALKAVKTIGAFNYLTKLKKNTKVILESLKSGDPYYSENYSINRKYPEIIKYMLELNPYLLPTGCKEKSLILAAYKKSIVITNDKLDEQVLNDKEFIKQLIDLNPNSFDFFMYENYKNDREMVRYGLERNPDIFERIHYNEFDKELRLFLVKIKPKFYQYYPKEYQNDREIFLIYHKMLNVMMIKENDIHFRFQ